MASMPKSMKNGLVNSRNSELMKAVSAALLVRLFLYLAGR